MQKPLKVVIYTCHIKKDIFMQCIFQQKKKIQNLMKITNWTIIEQYDDGYTDIENPNERPEFIKMCQNVPNNRFLCSKIVVFDPKIFIHDNFKIYDFIEKLKKKNISIFTVNPIYDSNEKHGELGQTVEFGLQKYYNTMTNCVYLLFTGKINENKKPSECYKCSFQHILHLHEILKRDCLGNNWMEILRLSDMKKIFYYECLESEELHSELYKTIMGKCKELNFI